MAKKSQESERHDRARTQGKFGDFARMEAFTPDEAVELAGLNIHKPLAHRQSVAARRKALARLGRTGQRRG